MYTIMINVYFRSEFSAKPGIPAELRVEPTNPIIVLDDVKCTGSESSVLDCDASPDANNCLSGAAELAAVQCVTHKNTATQRKSFCYCHADSPENCHLNVKKLPKTTFFQKKLRKIVI